MKILAQVQGKKIYDPRDGELKVSSNPALVMLDLASSGHLKTDWVLKDDIFLSKIKMLADYCDGVA